MVPGFNDGIEEGVVGHCCDRTARSEPFPRAFLQWLCRRRVRLPLEGGLTLKA